MSAALIRLAVMAAKINKFVSCFNNLEIHINTRKWQRRQAERNTVSEERITLLPWCESAIFCLPKTHKASRKNDITPNRNRQHRPICPSHCKRDFQKFLPTVFSTPKVLKGSSRPGDIWTLIHLDTSYVLLPGNKKASSLSNWIKLLHKLAGNSSLNTMYPVWDLRAMKFE